MLTGLQDEIRQALAPLHDAQPLCMDTVRGCLDALRQVLMQVEVHDRDFEVFTAQLIAHINLADMLEQEDAAAVVEKAIYRIMGQTPGVRIIFAVAHSEEEENYAKAPWETAKEAHPPTKNFPGFQKPDQGEKRVSSRISLHRWRDFEPDYGMHSHDMHHRDMNREDLDNIIRSLGRGLPDFGPEPPTGGSPALI